MLVDYYSGRNVFQTTGDSYKTWNLGGDQSGLKKDLGVPCT